MTWNDIVSLVRKAQRGDRSAYGELVKRFESTVYAIAMNRLRNPTDAQELVQEVFIHVMKKIGQLRDPLCFAGWLRQITVRMAINRLTRNVPVQGADQEVLQNTISSGETPLEEMVRREQRSAVLDSLKRLKEIDRDTLVAFYIRGRSLKEMSNDFATPVGTIKRRLHVARNRLREVIERDHDVLPETAPRSNCDDAALACV